MSAKGIASVIGRPMPILEAAQPETKQGAKFYQYILLNFTAPYSARGARVLYGNALNPKAGWITWVGNKVISFVGYIFGVWFINCYYRSEIQHEVKEALNANSSLEICEKIYALVRKYDYFKHSGSVQMALSAELDKVKSDCETKKDLRDLAKLIDEFSKNTRSSLLVEVMARKLLLENVNYLSKPGATELVYVVFANLGDPKSNLQDKFANDFANKLMQTENGKKFLQNIFLDDIGDKWYLLGKKLYVHLNETNKPNFAKILVEQLTSNTDLLRDKLASNPNHIRLIYESLNPSENSLKANLISAIQHELVENTNILKTILTYFPTFIEFVLDNLSDDEKLPFAQQIQEAKQEPLPASLEAKVKALTETVKT